MQEFEIVVESKLHTKDAFEDISSNWDSLGAMRPRNAYSGGWWKKKKIGKNYLKSQITSTTDYDDEVDRSALSDDEFQQFKSSTRVSTAISELAPTSKKMVVLKPFKEGEYP